MKPKGTKPIASNRQARRNYEILDTVEAGIVLRGSEVKSLRDAKVQITDAFARIDGNEVWLHQLHIAPWLYSQSHTGHDPDAKRKLLLHHHEIMRLKARVDPEHLSLIPLSIYFKDGKAKGSKPLRITRGLPSGAFGFKLRDYYLDEIAKQNGIVA